MEEEELLTILTRTKESYNKKTGTSETTTESISILRSTLEMISESNLGPEKFIEFLTTMMEDFD